LDALCNAYADQLLKSAAIRKQGNTKNLLTATENLLSAANKEMNQY
jgi:hypothetical protein